MMRRASYLERETSNSKITCIVLKHAAKEIGVGKNKVAHNHTNIHTYAITPQSTKNLKICAIFIKTAHL
jgi:hypothetical protein